MEKLYTTIKELRKTAGLSQEDISTKLHVKQATYCYWENGKVEMTVKTLDRIAKILKVPVTYFFEKNIKQLMNDLKERMKEVDEQVEALREVKSENVHELYLPKIPREPIEHYIEKIEHLEKIIYIQTSDLHSKSTLIKYQEKEIDKYQIALKAINENLTANKKFSPALIKIVSELARN